MNQNLRRTVTIAAIAAVIAGSTSGCFMLPTAPDAASDTASDTASDAAGDSGSKTPEATPEAQVDKSPDGAISIDDPVLASDYATMGFSDGDALPADVDIDWVDLLANHPNWVPDPAFDGPGQWGYVNVAGTCSVRYHQGVLGDAGDMDDREASAALLAAIAPYPPGDLEALSTFGVFLLSGSNQPVVEQSQFTLSIDGDGSYYAARAFVASNFSIDMRILCHGDDIFAVAHEVLSHSLVMMKSPQ